MDQAVRNLIRFTGCSVIEAIESASLKPAKLLGLYPQKGVLEPGSDADFNLLSQELHGYKGALPPNLQGSALSNIPTG